MKNNTVIRIVTVLIVLSCLFILFSVQSSKSEPIDLPQEKVESSRLYLKLYEDEVCLIKDDKIIKKYEIDITLLPGEDILSLTQGIEIATHAEADLLAEDFDG